MTTPSQSTAYTRDLPGVVAAMMRPEIYRDHPRSIESRQTHISYVFLAGDYVYKIKKPVRFSFLDASSLARRHQLCLDEVRLNRRLAPDIYLGVVAIIQSGSGELALSAEAVGAAEAGAVVEWAVWMRRMSEAAMLDRMVAGGKVSIAQIRAVASRLAAFHLAAGARPALAEWGGAAVWG